MLGYKKYLVVLMTVCLLFVFSGHIQAVQEPISVKQVMTSQGCRVEYLDINGWSILKGTSKSLPELKLLAKKAAEFFGITQNYDVFVSQGQGITQVNMTGTNDEGQVVSIICQSQDFSNDEPGQPEAFIVVNIVDHNMTADVSSIKARTEHFLRQIGAEPSVTLTYVGNFQGRLGLKEMQSLCNTLLESLKAKVVEGMHHEELVSISGYSPLFGKGVISRSRQVNVQVAMRYNSYKDRTYIWVGMPIISIEY